MITPIRSLLLASAVVSAVFAARALAVDDVAPVDAKPILEALRALKEQQTVSIKTNKQRFIQEATAAASNPARAAELWEEAIRATQFQGVAKENAQFKDWKDKEGDALKSREVLSALHLYFNWLALTLQHSSGVETKTLFPAVLNHVHEVAADQAAMDALEETLKKEKDAPAATTAAKRPTTAREKEKRQDDQAVKRMHDQIAKQALTGSAFVQWMRLADYLGDPAPQKGRGKGRGDAAKPDEASGWEWTPGSYDGIFGSILLPEMRANKDLRLLEYWDTKLKREYDQAMNTQKKFEIDKYTQVRRPQILWSRAADMARIGQRNRAVNDMFKQIKEFPTHPDSAAWITELEVMLAPPPPASAADQPAASAALPGSQ